MRYLLFFLNTLATTYSYTQRESSMALDYTKIINDFKSKDSISLYEYSFPENIDFYFLGEALAEIDYQNGIELIFLTTPRDYSSNQLCILEKNEINWVFTYKRWFSERDFLFKGYNNTAWKHINKSKGINEIPKTDTIPEIADFSYRFFSDSVLNIHTINDSTVLVKSKKNTFTPWKNLSFTIKTSNAAEYTLSQDQLLNNGFESPMTTDGEIQFNLHINRHSSLGTCSYQEDRIEISVFQEK